MMAYREPNEQEMTIRDKWHAFVEDYNALLVKYNVELDFGCGCCTQGHRMDGIEPYLNWPRV